MSFCHKFNKQYSSKWLLFNVAIKCNMQRHSDYIKNKILILTSLSRMDIFFTVCELAHVWQWGAVCFGGGSSVCLYVHVCVCACSTMFVLWGHADRWPGHLYVCGWTVPPLSALQRPRTVVAARRTVVSVNLMFWEPELTLTPLLPPCHVNQSIRDET